MSSKPKLKSQTKAGTAQTQALGKGIMESARAAPPSSVHRTGAVMPRDAGDAGHQQVVTSPRGSATAPARHSRCPDPAAIACTATTQVDSRSRASRQGSIASQ